MFLPLHPRSPSCCSSYVWSWHNTCCYRTSTVPRSPYHMSTATELIHLVAARLLLFLSASTPDASGHLPPPTPHLNFQFQNWSCWIKHWREAHLASCDVRVSVRGHALVSGRTTQKRERREGKGGRREGGRREAVQSLFCVYIQRAIECRHWSLSCKLIGGVENSIKKENAETAQRL